MSHSRKMVDYFPWIYAGITEEEGYWQCPPLHVEEVGGPDEDVLLAITEYERAYAVSIESGKQWKRAACGNWTQLPDNPNGSHTGVGVFRNRIYFVGGASLGYIDHFKDAAARYDEGFLKAAPWHAMTESNGFLNISNFDYIARIDKNYNFSNNVYDAKVGYWITDLVEFGDDLIYTTATGDEGGDILIQTQNSNVIAKIHGKNGRISSVTGSQIFPFKRIQRISTRIAPYNKAYDDTVALWGFDGRVMCFDQQESSNETIYFQYSQASTGEQCVMNSLATAQVENYDAVWDQRSVTRETPHKFTGAGNLILASFKDLKTGRSYVDRIDKNKYAQGFVETPVKMVSAELTGVEPRKLHLFYDESVGDNDFDLEFNINSEGWDGIDEHRFFGGERGDIGFTKNEKRHVYETTTDDLPTEENHDITYIQARITINPGEEGTCTPIGDATIYLTT